MSNDQIRADIVEIVAKFPEGASISDLEDRLDVHRRTIQRRLRDLVEEGHIRREGEGRATRYFALSSLAPESAVETAPTGNEASAPQLALSPEAKRTRSEIQRPVTSREPVGYRVSFLEEYEPNATFYLAAPVRQELRDVGSLARRNLPAGTYARQILDRLLIDLSWNSSRLEGNTYSLLETERLLEAGIEASERDPFETQMILNHKSAIEFLVESVEDLGFDRTTILNLHALLSENLLADPSNGGALRRQLVGISGSVFEPLQNPHLIEECFDKLLQKAAAIEDPFEQAFFFLVHLPYLQPFIDVKKRVSRLGANIPFIRQNLCPLSFIDVTSTQYAHAMLAIYELNETSLLRDLFVWAYRRSAARYRAIRESLGEPDPFRLARRREIKTLVGRIIREKMARQEATGTIERHAESLPKDERHRFVEVVEEELESLHEGNFARYRVCPSEFRAWQASWDG